MKSVPWMYEHCIFHNLFGKTMFIWGISFVSTCIITEGLFALLSLYYIIWYLMQHTFVYHNDVKMLNGGIVLWMECNINLCTVATQYCSGGFNVYTTIFPLTSYSEFSATILCPLSMAKIQFSNVIAYKCESTNETTHAFGDQWGVNLYMLFHSSLKQLMVTGRT